MIVDDNRINLNVEEKIFAKLGCQADLEDNPFKLLERMDEKEYDIVFLDISMPEISGYEISREIRKYHKWDDTILIALSANVGQDVIEKSKESGMNDYLAKPFSIDELAELLDKYLGSKLSSDENVGGKINTEILENMENVKLEDSVEKTENGIWHEENDKELPVNSEVERDSIVIDTDGLLELVNEDKNAVKQLFLIFIEDNADFMKNLQRNLVDKKFKEIRCEIHRMEGVAGNLHCYALVHALEKVHQDVRKKTIDEKKWKKLEEEFCKVINFMKQYTEEE